MESIIFIVRWWTGNVCSKLGAKGWQPGSTACLQLLVSDNFACQTRCSQLHWTVVQMAHWWLCRTGTFAQAMLAVERELRACSTKPIRHGSCPVLQVMMSTTWSLSRCRPQFLGHLHCYPLHWRDHRVIWVLWWKQMALSALPVHEFVLKSMKIYRIWMISIGCIQMTLNWTIPCLSS